MIRDRGFYLAEFDTDTANLDLIVHPAREFEYAVGSQASEIARAVQRRRFAVCEVILHKSLRGQFGAIQITPGNPSSADVDFAHNTPRDELTLAIEHIHPRIGDGTSDRHHGLTGNIHALPIHRGDRRFGRTVAIEKFCRGKPLANAPLQRDGQTFAARGQATQRTAGGDLPLLDDRSQQRRYEAGNRYTLLRHQLHQVPAVVFEAGPRQHQTRSGAQRLENFPHRVVEAQRCRLQAAVRVLERKVAASPGEVIAYTPVGDEHSFRRAGRAGRVNDIGDVRGARGQIQVLVRGVRRGNPFIDVQYPGGTRRERGGDNPSRHQDDGIGIDQHRGQPRARIRGIERDIGRAGLQHGEHGNDHLGRAFETNSHPLAALRAEGSELAGQPIRAAVELVIADLSVPGDEPGRVRVLARLPLEGRVATTIRRETQGRTAAGRKQSCRFGSRKQRQTRKRTIGPLNRRHQQRSQLLRQPSSVRNGGHLGVDIEPQIIGFAARLNAEGDGIGAMAGMNPANFKRAERFDQRAHVVE